MSSVTVARSIAAPPSEVFDVIAHIENFSKAIPHITDVEFVSERKRGVGARFKETRLMKGRESSSEIEVTEYTENQSIRLVSDQGGTIWDTVFTTQKDAEGCLLKMEMTAKPYKFTAKLSTPLIMRMIKSALVDDMDSVKSYCES